ASDGSGTRADERSAAKHTHDAQCTTPCPRGAGSFSCAPFSSFLPKARAPAAGRPPPRSLPAPERACIRMDFLALQREARAGSRRLNAFIGLALMIVGLALPLLCFE